MGLTTVSSRKSRELSTPLRHIRIDVAYINCLSIRKPRRGVHGSICCSIFLIWGLLLMTSRSWYAFFFFTHTHTHGVCGSICCSIFVIWGLLKTSRCSYTCVYKHARAHTHTHTHTHTEITALFAAASSWYGVCYWWHQVVDILLMTLCLMSLMSCWHHVLCRSLLQKSPIK